MLCLGCWSLECRASRPEKREGRGGEGSGLLSRCYPGNPENRLPVALIDWEKGFHAAGVKEKVISGVQTVEKVDAGMNIIVCRQCLQLSLIPVSDTLIGKGLTVF